MNKFAVTDDNINFEMPKMSSNLATVSDAETPTEKDDEVENAKAEVVQKQNEEDFINEMYANNQAQYATQEKQPPPQKVEETPQVNLLEKYNQIEQFVDTSAQQGGIKTDNEGYWNPKNWGKPVNIEGENITMKGVKEPLIGISNTGQLEFMQPDLNYFFKGAKNVTEYPLNY
jgi:hypothetical protein